MLIFRALYFFHDQIEICNSGDVMSQKCHRCQDSDNEDMEPCPKKNRDNVRCFEQNDKLLTACSGCNYWSPFQRASYDCNGLKKEVENYKKDCGGSFEVHIILSKPVNDEDEFLQIASQPGAIE